MTTPVQPDIEDVVTAFLSAYQPLVNLTAKVGTQLPDTKTPPALFIVVIRLGGPAGYPGWVDHPRLQVESWGDTKKRSYNGIAAARSGLLDLPGVHDGAVISAADELTGPQWLPDSTVSPARARYFVTFALTSHPVP